jgi:acetyl/propionyl-CoA carboxylase alpha subunit
MSDKLYKVEINNKAEHQVSFDESGSVIKVDEQVSVWDIISIKMGATPAFHILKDNKSFTAEVLEADYSGKSFVIRINGNKYSVVVKDRFDALLHDLGMDTQSAAKLDNLKAPMPGLVLDVRVSEGQQVLKNDPIIVLEAMKMENILKAQADGIVKNISVKKGDKVEKNQVMITFI